MQRKRDISSWETVDTSSLNRKEQKRFRKRLMAVVKYLTTDTPIDDISLQTHFSSDPLLSLIEKCLTPHEDGNPWGYRALLPGANVMISTSEPVAQEQLVPVETNDANVSPPEIIDTSSDGTSPNAASQLLPNESDVIAHEALDEDTAKRKAIQIPAHVHAEHMDSSVQTHLHKEALMPLTPYQNDLVDEAEQHALLDGKGDNEHVLSASEIANDPLLPVEVITPAEGDESATPVAGLEEQTDRIVDAVSEPSFEEVPAAKEETLLHPVQATRLVAENAVGKALTVRPDSFVPMPAYTRDFDSLLPQSMYVK